MVRPAFTSMGSVFDSVGGKAQPMKLAYEFAIVGDDEPVPLADRPEMRAMLAEPDFGKRLAMYASLAVGIDRQLSSAWRAFEGAATSDPEAAKLYVAMVQQRRRAMQQAAQMFADAGALRPDLDIEVAADLMWFYNDPSLYDKLVRQRGWSVDRFQAWLTEALSGPAAGEGSRGRIRPNSISWCAPSYCPNPDLPRTSLFKNGRCPPNRKAGCGSTSRRSGSTVQS